MEKIKNLLKNQKGMTGLETGEQFEITLDATLLNLYGVPPLQANDSFTIQVKPALGSTITIERQLPPAIEPVMDLH